MKNEEFFFFLAFIKNFATLNGRFIMISHKKSGANTQVNSTHLIYISSYYLITFLPSCISRPLESAFTC